MSTEKRTEYAVARGNEIVTEWTPEQGRALMELAEIQRGMQTARLEPDVHLVESDVTISTKRTRAHAWVDPNAPAEGAQGDAATDGAGMVLPASGVWGDNSSPRARGRRAPISDGVPVIEGSPAGEAAALAAARAAGTALPQIGTDAGPASAEGIVDARPSTGDGIPAQPAQGTGTSTEATTGGDPK